MNGNEKESRSLVEKLESTAHEKYVLSSDLAMPFVALGDFDRAFFYVTLPPRYRSEVRTAKHIIRDLKRF
jgi:hypothetical protein